MKKIDFSSLVLFENEDYILVNKPHDISSLDERDLTRPSIIRMAKEYWDDSQLCHRLDKETSGVLAIAKHAEAYRNLSLQFQKRQVSKCYHAVGQGLHDLQDFLIDFPIAIAGKSAVRIDRINGKRSETLVRTLAQYRAHTLFECKPLTGRMHQIRIHLAAIKAAIVADATYGGKTLMLSDFKRNYHLGREKEVEQPLIKRVALHAQALGFSGMEGEQIEVTAPYPKDMKALLKQLERFA